MVHFRKFLLKLMQLLPSFTVSLPAVAWLLAFKSRDLKTCSEITVTVTLLGSGKAAEDTQPLYNIKCCWYTQRHFCYSPVQAKPLF